MAYSTKHSSTCPVCGTQSLETVRPDLPGTLASLFSEQSDILFECRHCLWSGSTTTLNMI